MEISQEQEAIIADWIENYDHDPDRDQLVKFYQDELRDIHEIMKSAIDKTDSLALAKTYWEEYKISVANCNNRWAKILRDYDLSRRP